MSFVLEALRKSEQERQQATAPGLGVLFPAIVEERTTSTVRPMLVAVIAATSIAALIWFVLRPQAAVPVPIAPQKAPAAAPEMPKAAAPIVAPPVSSIPEVRSPIAGATNLQDTTLLPVAAARSADMKAAPVHAKAETFKGGTKTAPATSSEVKRPASASPTPADAPPSRELSLAPPRNLPDMTIAGYIHDDQAGSMAMINDKLVREGEEVSPGLRLEKILPDGAIFSYQGERFRR